MPQAAIRVVAVVGMVVLVGCSGASEQPLVDPVTVRVTSADSTRAARFTMDVTGVPATFATPGLRGQAVEPSLTASTPAELVLGPGTTSASFRGLENYLPLD